MLKEYEAARIVPHPIEWIAVAATLNVGQKVWYVPRDLSANYSSYSRGEKPWPVRPYSLSAELEAA
jgi:hypothetical protein